MRLPGAAAVVFFISLVDHFLSLSFFFSFFLFLFGEEGEEVAYIQKCLRLGIKKLINNHNPK